MRIILASNIHGSTYYRRKMLDIYSESGVGRLMIPGDLLYHGPRNDLPREHALRKVIVMLDPFKNRIYVIRGSYGMEVDRMVLEFPILADYGLLVLEGKVFYVTHGHVYNQNRLPPSQDGDILIHGHTYILKAEAIEAEGNGHITVLNPGSVSIPKGGSSNVYTVLENGVFPIWALEGKVVGELKL